MNLGDSACRPVLTREPFCNKLVNDRRPVADIVGGRHTVRMNVPTRRWIAFGSLFFTLALPACQPPRYNLTSSFTAGRLFFDAEFPGIWPFKWGSSQVEASYVEVVTSNQVLWAIQASKEPKCTTATQNPFYREPTHLGFPLAFGVTPRCYVTLTPARPLPEKTAILVRAQGALTEGSGQFKVRGHKILAVDDGYGVVDTAPSQNPRWQIEAALAGKKRR